MKSLVVILLIILYSTRTIATDAPKKLDGAIIVAAENVRELMISGAKVYDVRTEPEYADGHIPRALNIPYQKKLTLGVSIPDKETPAIFHCNGHSSWRSYKASAKAVKEGFKQVYWFRGGIPEWKNRGFSVEK